MNIQIADIGHVIQLAIAPVFLLTGSPVQGAVGCPVRATGRLAAES